MRPLVPTFPRLRRALIPKFSCGGVGLGRRLRHVWQNYRPLVLFGVGLLLLDLVIGSLSPLWDRYSPDDYLERIRGCREHRQDVIVLGGSPVSEGIDPSHLVGMLWRGQSVERAFALGLPGGTASEFRHAIREAAPVPPRLLIYGCSASDWNDRRNEPMGPNSLMKWHDLGVWVRDRPESAEWVTRHFVQSRLAQSWDLFQYRRGIRLWAADQIETAFPGSFPDAAREARDGKTYAAALRDGNGYAPNPRYVEKRYDVEKLSDPPPPTIPHLRNYTLGAHVGYLNRMLDWAREHDVDVVFVDMPVTEDLEVRMHPQEFRCYRELLHRIAGERGYPVLHATRAAIPVDDTDFADVIHLNGRGAAKMSRWLRGRLEAVR